MRCLTIITDEELVQKLAVYYDNEGDIDDIKSEIIHKIGRKSDVEEKDIDLINQIIETAKAIQRADFDLLRQSKRMKKLGKYYHKLKNQLLSRMKSESGVLSETT